MIDGGNGMERAIAARQAQMGGDWFFWIAGLSLVNSVMLYIHSPIGVFFGLGTTELIDFSAPSVVVALGLDIVAAGFFALYGIFARRGARWAFLVGMVFYLLDALIILLFTHQYLEVAAHAYALFRIFQGFQGAQRLSQLSVSSAGYPGSGSVPPSPNVWPPPPSV